MAKPKKKPNPVASQLPDSVKKSIPKYKRVRTKTTLKVWQVQKTRVLC